MNVEDSYLKIDYQRLFISRVIEIRIPILSVKNFSKGCFQKRSLLLIEPRL
ncbi:hypothetical protein LEP1GSC188_3807 [Leptospira weilii serovar Topaz str. LT2116]|uniref:Uncharacterized protein n=1 Tax=Leptospira weilii serovar Topaz str. LT2116 TaxID=1088540 RepID=M3G402_9LEPT|nr:hypothetical protein LEP1GSC188_3807 [Leptospira weilii serovar Topaz str. LT2116]